MRIVETKLISSAGKLDKLPPEGPPEVAFAGRSNVGKSSLLNALTGRKNLFKVSQTPGRTRTIVHVDARLTSNAHIYLVDLPGYGFAKVARQAKKAWANLMESYLQERTTLHLVVLLVDVRRGPEQEEADLIDFLEENGVPAILVATKLDRVRKGRQQAELNQLQKELGIDVIGTSALKKTGIDQLEKVILRSSGY